MLSALLSTLLLTSSAPLQDTEPAWLGTWCDAKSGQVFLFERERAGRLVDGKPVFFRLHARDSHLVLERWSHLLDFEVEPHGQDTLHIAGAGVDAHFSRCELPDELLVEPYVWPEDVELSDERVAEIRAELARREAEDQRVRQNYQDHTPEQMGEMRRVDADNFEYLKALLEEVGWIDAQRFGSEAASAAFLIVQHCSDLRMMCAALPFIDEDVRAGRLSGQTYALLFDRFQLNRGYKQRYGTQISGTPAMGSVLMPCEDYEGVDDLRAEVGLGPVANYLALFRDEPDGDLPGYLPEYVADYLAKIGTSAGDEEWISLFNGRDLDGWRVKLRGHELDDNYKNTFRVEDGVLKVSYDGYETFDGKFGHLFYATSFSRYRLRIEYRFVGEQCPGGPGWAFRNSGVMLHGQSPESMGLDQEFPVSIEAQMLGGDGTNARPTGNLCTPGTHVVMGDDLIRQHCVNSTSKTYHGDDWVTLEIEVLGNESIRHYMDGELVLEYHKPQLDEGDADAERLKAAGGKVQLDQGYLSLQAESHPIHFRKVELLELE